MNPTRRSGRRNKGRNSFISSAEYEMITKRSQDTSEIRDCSDEHEAVEGEHQKLCSDDGI